MLLSGCSLQVSSAPRVAWWSPDSHLLWSRNGHVQDEGCKQYDVGCGSKRATIVVVRTRCADAISDTVVSRYELWSLERDCGRDFSIGFFGAGVKRFS